MGESDASFVDEVCQEHRDFKETLNEFSRKAETPTKVLLKCDVEGCFHHSSVTHAESFDVRWWC